MNTNRLLRSGTITLGILLATGAAIANLAAAQARSSENRKAIRSCAEVGLCQKGKRTMLLNNERIFSKWAMQYALARGCSLTKRREKESRIVCPETAAVPYAEPERVFELHDVPSVTQVGAMAAQSRGYNGGSVRIALLDSGVDTTHPELAGVVQATANFTTEGVDDILGHGTHVAGIAAGQGIGTYYGNRVLGVAPGAELIVAKVCNDQGFCLEGDINAGVEWAVAQGAKVINMSLGAGSFMGDCDDDPLAAEANWAVDQGVVVVAASGNQGDGGEGVASPGCGSKVIAVGAVNSLDERPSWSGYGSALDIVAPGVGILSSYPCARLNVCPNVGVVPGNGTSMATPHVAAAVATLFSIDPGLTPQRAMDLLSATAVDLGTAGFDRFYGHGRLDLNAAIDRLLEDMNPAPPASSEASSSEASSSSSSVAPSSQSVSSSTSSAATSVPTSSASSSSSESTTSSAQSTTSSWSSWATSSTSSASRVSSTSSFARPCVPSDWKCSEFHDCGENGMQRRECELKNERCIGSEVARPPLDRTCEPRREDNKSSKRGEDDHGKDNQGRDDHREGDNRGPGNGRSRSLPEWIDWLRNR